MLRVPPELRHAIVGGFHAAPGVGHGLVGGVVNGVDLDVALNTEGRREAGDEGAVLIPPILLKGFPAELGLTAKQIDESKHSESLPRPP